jgi:hypothetical protein
MTSECPVEMTFLISEECMSWSIWFIAAAAIHHIAAWLPCALTAYRDTCNRSARRCEFTRAIAADTICGSGRHSTTAFVM